MIDWESEDTGCRQSLPGMNFGKHTSVICSITFINKRLKPDALLSPGGCHGDGGRGRIKALDPTFVKTVPLQSTWCHMLWSGYIIGGRCQLLLTCLVHQSHVLSEVICTAESLFFI